jgi:hypothetical protein
VKASFIALLACLICSSSVIVNSESQQMSKQEATRAAQALYSQSVDESIEQTVDDIRDIADIVGSIIIRETRYTKDAIEKSEENKQKVTACAAYLIAEIIKAIRKGKNKKNRRSRQLLDKKQFMVDQITEKLLEIFNEN